MLDRFRRPSVGLAVIAAEPAQTPVPPVPPEISSPGLDWGLVFAAAGTVVATTGLVVGWVTALLGRQFSALDKEFNSLDKDLVKLVERNRERFDKQDQKFGKLFDLIRDLDNRFVSRAEFDRELERVRSDIEQIRGQEAEWVSRLEAQIQELSERADRNFQAIRSELVERHHG